MKGRYCSTRFSIALLALVSLIANGFAQGVPPAPPPPQINISTNPLLKAFRWRSIGPASMGGRIDDIAAVESNTSVFYVGFATGGVWKTTNNGITFEPIFDTYASCSIGDIAICQQNPNLVWVGTGEANNRQSATIGDGIYKSTDAGKTFTNVGLKDTQSIARIVTDPKDEKVVYVAALGHLFGANSERGIYKTTDGGTTWSKSKFIDDDTGFTDLVMDAADNRILYAASYQRRRTSWGYNGGGPGSGLWKTTDAGKTWAKMEGAGLPEGLLGRIGLDVSRSNPNVIYAQIEVGASTGTGVEEQPGAPTQANQPTRPATPPGEPAKSETAEPKSEETAKASEKSEGEKTERPSRRSRRNRQTSSETTEPAAKTTDKAEGKTTDKSAAKQTGDKSRLTKEGTMKKSGETAAAPVDMSPNGDPKKSGVWRSDDKGKTWRIVSNNNNRPMYYSQIRVDPKNDQIVYTGGAPFHKSTDGGKTFKVVGGIAHSDHHAIWIDPQNGNHLIIGNDGGLDVTYDQCENWEFINTIPAAQFYGVGADMRRPYYVCGGLQDNGSWCGPSATRNPLGITNADWFRVGGGDGFYAQIDPTDYNTIYSESQNGALNRVDLKTGRNVSIRPRAAARPRPQNNPEAGAPARNPQAGTPASPAPQQFGGFGGQPNIVPPPPVGEQYRFNWSTPVILSPHNPRTLYVGANRLFKSVDRGDTWRASPDLTKQIDRNNLPIMGVGGREPMASKHDGYANYSNITTIAESPAQAGILWVGTDDGNVQVSQDGGATWNNVAKNLQDMPQNNPQISRVEPSHFDAATCYLAIDNHRNDDFKPYLFVTRDFGATWTAIVGNLSAAGNVNVVREDPKNKNLLYVGTEFGLFISMNGGATWEPFMNGMPSVRIDDILIHPRDNDLIVGTHGRGIYILDDITALQQMNERALNSEVHLFDVRPGVQWLNDTTLSRVMGGAKHFRGANPQPGTAISYYLKAAPQGDVKITIQDITGKVIRNMTGTKEVGLNRVQWNLRGDTPPRPAGAPQGGGGGGGFGNFAPLAAPGTYLVKVQVGDKEYTTKVVVEEDVWKDR
jgi:photosystem II stability/assembly factor-like uncharacterized protein